MAYRTSRIVIRRGGKHKAFYQITLANMRHAKAVYNTTLFHIRNLFTGLKKEEALRTENEREVIARILAAMEDVNAKRISRGRTPYELPTAEDPYLSDYLWLSVMNRILKQTLPRPETFYSKLEQMTVRSACRAMKSFTASIRDYAHHPEKYLGRPHLPRYIKADTFTLDYDCQMVSMCGSGRKHSLELKAVTPHIKTGRKTFENIVSVRLAFRHGEIIASVCTKQEEPVIQHLTELMTDTKGRSTELGGRVLLLQCYMDHLVGRIVQTGALTTPGTGQGQKTGILSGTKPDADRMLGIDPGVKNFLAICPGYGTTPFLIPGGKLKAQNQYYNKERARLQGRLKKEHDRTSSHRLDRLEARREDFLFNYFHQTACLVVDHALRERAGTIVVGHNKGWKQGVDMLKKENQKFVYIPHQRFFNILEDKAARAGIRLVYTEESYTSQACSLTRDDIPCYERGKSVPTTAFHGRRPKRGLYVCEDGRKLNADINGAANIIRKYSETGLQEDLSYLTGPVRVIHVA